MIRQARVVGIEPTNGTVRVVLDEISHCQRCSRGHGCGMRSDQTSGRVAGDSVGNLQLACTSDIMVQADQQVLIEIEEQGSAWLWSVFGAYGLPLLGMILATVLTTAFATSDFAEIFVILAAAAGLLAGIWLWRRVSSWALVCADSSLCLQSARIVDVVPYSN